MSESAAVRKSSSAELATELCSDTLSEKTEACDVDADDGTDASQS